MPVTRSGIFTQQEFEGREILKLAPDAFVTINGALGARVLAPTTSNGAYNLEIRGGISSINVNAALRPAGASTATLEVIAPQYKGLHEDYYVTMPNGTRIPYFTPMMEVKIFMKGRYVDEVDKRPRYYPVFWGVILDVNENYSGGVHTFSLSCGDLLHWWKWQRVTVRPADSSLGFVYGAPTNYKVPTVFERLNPWETIVALFYDNYFIENDKQDPTQRALYNFVYFKVSKTGIPPDFNNIDQGTVKATFGGLAKESLAYWDRRFGFNISNKDDPNKVPLEIYGMRTTLDINTIVDRIEYYRKDSKAKQRSDLTAALDLDEGILARIQPFGSLDLFSDSGEPLVQSKLDIANQVVEQTQMEFFVDTNGTIVFKPPFYNLDVSDPVIPQYTLLPQDIIDFSAQLKTDNIVNYLECTAPMRYDVVDAIENIGFHVDFESIKRYGLRTKSLALRYGNTPSSLRLIAAAEMSRINGAAFTGSVTIPLRPEMRLGYPVYMKHIDAYYYITGINHTFAFGNSASTALSLEVRRDRVFDDGTVTQVPGRILKGYVYQASTPVSLSNKSTASLDAKLEADAAIKEANLTDNPEVYQDSIRRAEVLKQAKILDGPKPGFLYDVRKAAILPTKTNPSDSDNYSVQAITSNELLMITDDTVPFTDINGYRHIGAFPYGANLRLKRNLETSDVSNPIEQNSQAVEAQTGTSGVAQEDIRNEDPENQTTPTENENNMLDQTMLPSDSQYSDPTNALAKIAKNNKSGDNGLPASKTDAAVASQLGST